MLEEAERLIRHYRSKGAVVDANLLVLLIIGLYDRQRVSAFKRTKQYTIEDFDLLDRLLGQLERIVVTPGILTETSNLVGKEHLPVLRVLINRFEEQHTPSATLAAPPVFDRFGLTDAGIATLATRHLILTADFPLAEMLRSRGHDVLNFNHLRPLNWR